jgi:hypothetical protein
VPNDADDPLDAILSGYQQRKTDQATQEAEARARTEELRTQWIRVIRATVQPSAAELALKLNNAGHTARVVEQFQTEGEASLVLQFTPHDPATRREMRTSTLRFSSAGDSIGASMEVHPVAGGSITRAAGAQSMKELDASWVRQMVIQFVQEVLGR